MYEFNDFRSGAGLYDQSSRSARSAATDLSRVILRAYSGRRVLLVEDNPVSQRVSSELLVDVGLSVDVAGNGAQAIAKACNKPFELIFMDIHLPEMDGIQACQQIRAIPRLAKVPIVAMTAGSLPEDREQCLRAGMNDFIAKPFDQVVLYAVLLKWLAQPLEFAPCHSFPEFAK